jgi:HEAT repeats
MARGRKGPPQDSIDSILLAMSRRNDIDDDTMDHYFNRLDEEWTEGAREKVLHLLRTKDLAAYSAAMLILSELATEFDLEELEDVIADPTVSDMAKLTIAPVLKELNSEMADDGIIEYLNDPETAMLQMQMHLLEMVGQSELGVESLLEDVLSMPLERRLGFIGWLGSSQDPRAANLLIPLLENSTTKVVEAAIDALEQLGPTTAQQSIPALNYLVATTSNRQVKQQARAALGRLTMQLAPGGEESAMASARLQQLPLYEARASYVDGSGAQMMMISWRRSDGLLKGVNVLYQDQWGIKDCFGTDEMEEERWAELVENMEEQGFGSFQVSLEYCRALIAEARAVNKRLRHKLPVAYSIWRPFIEGDESAKKHTPTVATTLEPLPFSPELAPLAQRGDELYAMYEFTSWMFEPLASIQPYVGRYLSIRNRIETERRSGSVRKRKASQKVPLKSREERLQGLEANLEALVIEAIDACIDDEWRKLYDVRLRRQGVLFQLVGRDEDAHLVSAVAAALRPDSGQQGHDQPFVRALMHRSLESGFFRLMAQAMENSPLGGLPFGLFADTDKDDSFF